MNQTRSELGKLFSLAVPVAGAQVGGMLMGTVDTLMVGRVGVGALAAAAIANAFSFAVLLLGVGIVHGIDPFVSQAHGAGRGQQAGLALQRGLVAAAIASLPIAGLWLYTEPILIAFGQEPALAALAAQYTIVKIPSIPFFLAFTAMRQYLQGRELVRPAMWVILAANLVNAFVNWVLIFGNLGAPALGLVGAGYATMATRISMALGLLAILRGFSLHEGAWRPWSWQVLNGPALVQLFRIGIPVAIQMGLEMWAFSVAAFLAGRLDPVALAAHSVVLNMAALSFMFATGIAQGASARVGNLLGAGRPDLAQHSAWLAIGAGAGVMTIAAGLFVSLRHQLPALYTPDTAVIAAGAAILPIAGVFQVFDGIQAVACGVLRAIGRTRPAALANALGYWVLALPLGAWLSTRAGWGLAGIWWGLALGLAVVASLLVLWLRRNGPATATALVSAHEG